MMRKVIFTISFVLAGLLTACGNTESTVQTEAASEMEAENLAEKVVDTEVSEEEYKKSCETFDYKEYFRNDQKYKREKIYTDIVIDQVIEEDCRGYDASGNEYYVVDMRDEKDKFRLMNDDYITVYGEYDGVGQITRAIGHYDEDIFVINARYIVLHEENEQLAGASVQSGGEISDFDIQQFSGTWWDLNSQRCHMEIEYLEENQFLITINWASSAADDTEWTMVGYYNNQTGQLNYVDGEKANIHCQNNGDEIINVVYTDGTGNFYISGDYLYWNDLKEHAGDSCYFEKEMTENGNGDYESSGLNSGQTEDLSEWTIEFVFPYSDIDIIPDEELRAATDAELRIGKNEIYANYGRMFNSQDLRDYFNSRSWYNPSVRPEDFNENVFTDIERENIKRIQAEIDRRSR